MQKLRRLVFFDKFVVNQVEESQNKRAGALPTLENGIQKLKIVSCVGSDKYIWIGDAYGFVHKLDNFYTLSSFCAFDKSILFCKYLSVIEHLVIIGDDGNRGGIKYKCYNLNKVDLEGFPTIIKEAKLFSQKNFQNINLKITSFDSNELFSALALGTNNSGLFLYQGDLIKDKTYKLRILMSEIDEPITAVHFLKSNNEKLFLFVCTSNSISSYIISSKNEIQLVYNDVIGGVNLHCSSIIHPTQSLMVMREGAVFTYDPEQGNLSAVPCDGSVYMLSSYKAYFVAVTTENDNTLISTNAVGKNVQRNLLSVCLSYTEPRFVAYSGHFSTITHVFSAMNSIYVLTYGSAGNVLFELREKDVLERLDILIRKRLFDWATDIALKENLSMQIVQEVYRLHGDWLCEKRLFDQALNIYIKTIGYEDPSYVIEKYLDAQRIHNLANYLQKLHEFGVAEKEHTVLLFKCYTKLKDTSKLEEFLSMDYAKMYDLVAAVAECRSSGYFKLALDIALRQENHELYVTILVEDFKNYKKAILHLRTLPAPIACSILLKCGTMLIKEISEETLQLICDIIKTHKLNVDIFMQLFVDNSKKLEIFLREILDIQANVDGEISLGSSAIVTYLELLLREQKKKKEENQKLEENCNMDKKYKIIIDTQNSIMKLLREHITSEEDIKSALALCILYNNEVGVCYCAEKCSDYQLPLSMYMQKGNVEGMLNYCLKCGIHDPTLWTQTLTYLSAHQGTEAQILKVIANIEKQRLLPPLAVLGILKSNSSITVGALIEYLLKTFKKVSTALNESTKRVENDHKEILCMKNEIELLRNKPRIFQSTKCCQCGLLLELPTIHFYCMHSYHAYCVPIKSKCPKCAPKDEAKKILREQRELQARNFDEFFKFLRGSTDGFFYIAQYFGRGMFPRLEKLQTSRYQHSLNLFSSSSFSNYMNIISPNSSPYIAMPALPPVNDSFFSLSNNRNLSSITTNSR